MKNSGRWRKHRAACPFLLEGKKRGRKLCAKRKNGAITMKRSNIRSRIVILSAALLAATAMPAWAKWDEVGHIDVHRQGERFTRDIPLGGPVDRLQLTATGGDVLCRHVRATFGNGRTREVFHGTLREHRAQSLDLPGKERDVRKLSFQCGAVHDRNATIRVAADIGRNRDAWRRNPNFNRLWAKTFNWGSELVNDWQYLGAETFQGRRDSENRFAGFRGRHVDAVALKPLDANARCTRVVAHFKNGRDRSLDVNRGDLMRRGQYYKLDLPGDNRYLENLSLHCRAADARRVTIQIFTSH
jgi:hypothetical protein